jgi:hypothetical protein
MKKYLLIILLFTSCQLKNKEITLNDFYEKNGFITFEVEGRKFSTSNDEDLFIEWNGNKYRSDIRVYEIGVDYVQEPFYYIYLSLKMIDIGSYTIGDIKRVGFGQYIYGGGYNCYGELQIIENNGKYVRGTFSLVGVNTNPYTGVKTYKNINNGKFKLFIK